MLHTVSNQEASSSPKKDDSFAKLVGQFGKWQLIIFASVFLVKLSSGWVQMAILFLTPNLTFKCVKFSGNETKYGLNSTCYEDCIKYEYDTTPFNNTIISEWNLICEKRWLVSFTQMMLQLGILIGSIVFGFFSDRCGRKNTFLASIVMLIVFGFGVPFSPNYIVFTTLRFFLGVATAGTMVVSFVIIMECVGPRYRDIFGCLFQIPFILGHLTVPLFAYYFRNWDTYTLALAVPPLIYLIYFFVLTESPRWLISVGKVDEAKVIIKKAAEMNNLPTEKIDETVTRLSQEMVSRADEPKPNYVDLFRRSLWLKTTCCCLMWLINGLTFFGFNQYISQTSDNPFISVAAAGAIQIPSNLLTICLLKYYGRKVITGIFFALGGLCVLTLACVPHTFWLTLTLGTLGVSCAAIVATANYIYSSELFPTVVRNMGMGACSMSMRVGSMVAPFISNAVAVPWLPTIFFGCAPIAAGLICLLLPETKGRNLPDSMEDVQKEG